MNKKLKPWHSFLIAGVSYLLSWLIGGIIGNAFGFLGFLCILIGIGTYISNGLASRKREIKKNVKMT